MAKCIDCVASWCSEAGKNKDVLCGVWEGKAVEKSCDNCKFIDCYPDTVSECKNKNYAYWESKNSTEPLETTTQPAAGTTEAAKHYQVSDVQPKKKVYVAHPLRGNFEENMKRIECICKKLVAKAEVIPFSPLHAFSFFDPSGDQSLVMEYCYALLASCDELWLHDDWQNSEGCKDEAVFAINNGIKINIVPGGKQ